MSSHEKESPLDRPNVPSPQSRTFVVGDVHGCVNQLQYLLYKGHFNPSHDRLVHVGDLVNKGADSIEVVRFCLRLNALGVRGNHEDYLLQVVAKLRRDEESDATISEDSESTAKRSAEDDGCTELSPKSYRQVTLLAKKFLGEPDGEDLLEYLTALPYTLPLPELHALVVHAGFHCDRVTHSLTSDVDRTARRWSSVSALNETILSTHNPQELNTYSYHEKCTSSGSCWTAAVHWADEWALHAARISGSASEGTNCEDIAQPPLVIFGHDAQAGLQDRRPFALGLDSNCFQTGTLTAAIFTRADSATADVSKSSLNCELVCTQDSPLTDQRLRKQLMVTGLAKDTTAEGLRKAFFSSGPMEGLGDVVFFEKPPQALLNCRSALIAAIIFDSAEMLKKSLNLPKTATFKLFHPKPKSDVRLNVSGIHPKVNGQRLFNVFSSFGKVKARETFISKKFASSGVVTFYQPADAEKAQTNLNGQCRRSLCEEGALLRVSFAASTK